MVYDYSKIKESEIHGRGLSAALICKHQGISKDVMILLQ